MPDPGSATSRERLLQALNRAGGNRTEAAALLGVGRATLYRWMERLGLPESVFRLIGRRYQVTGILGRGQQATVFLVGDRARAMCPRALKLLDRRPADPEAEERLRREYRALSLLPHPGLVPVHDFGVDEATGQAFLVMDRVAGVPFALAGEGKEEAWVLHAARQVLDALGHLHRHGLVHRDIKSENILVDTSEGPEGPPKATLMDLGLADDLAAAGMAPGGTLLYLAPEILAGARASARSDIYALGVLLYLALAGRFPFQAATPDETIAAGSLGLPTPLSSIRPHTAAGIDEVLARFLAPDPADRYPDAQAAGEALDRLRESPVLRPAELRTGGLVGREREQAALLEALDPRRPAGPPAVLLTGEPGIGKTALMSAALSVMKLDGLRVARGVCRGGGDQGLGALAEILDEALAGAGGEGESPEDRLVRNSRQALEFVDPRRWNPATVSGEEKGLPLERSRALEELAGVLLQVAATGPLVLAFDDLHQADPFVLDLFGLLARRGRGKTLRLAATARNPADWPALEAVLSAAAAEGLTRTLPLGPLDAEGTRALAAQILGEARAAVSGDALSRLTGGNPFFLVMVLSELARRPGLSLESEGLELPPNGQAAIQSCLAGLGPLEKKVLEALACFGRPAAASDLERLQGSPRAAWLGALLDRRLVLAWPRDQVDLAHGYLRDAVLAGLDPPRRRALHRAWAEALRHDPSRQVETAFHLVEAGDITGNRGLFLEAASILEVSWRPQAAIPLLEAALAATPPDDPSRLSLFPRLERACNLVRDIPRAIGVCSAWAAEARSRGDLAAEARARGLLAARLRARGEWNAARTAARAALDLAEAAGDPGAIALGEKILASVHWLSWDHAQAVMHMERALRLYEQGADRRAYAIALHDISLLRALEGRGEAARGSLREAARLFDELGDRAWAAMVHGNEALVLSFQGDLAGAAALLSRTVEEVRGMGASLPLELVLENLGFIQLRLGRYSEALATGGELIDEALRYGRHAFRITGLLIRGEAHYQLDDRDAARDHHRLAARLAETLGEESQAQFARLAQARDARGDGLLGEAETAARLVLTWARERGHLRLITLAALELAHQALQAGDLAAAHAMLDQAEAGLSVNREDAPAHRAMALALRARALNLENLPALARGTLQEALGLAQRAGPADLELRLMIHGADLAGESGDALARHALLSAGARRYRQIADQQRPSEARARFLGRPDLAPLHAFLRRPRRGETTLSVAASPQEALAGLYEVSRTIALGGDLEPLLTRIVEMAVELAGAERGLLLLRDAATSELIPAAAAGVEEETTADAIRISQSALSRADLGSVVLAKDAACDPELSQAASVALFGIRSVMCVPLRAGGEVQGTLYVDTRARDTFFTEDDLAFLEGLAGQAALALAYGRLVGKLARDREALQRLAEQTHRFGQLIGRSPAMSELFRLLGRLAPTDLSVIVTGESGTGKELVARALHFNSPRRDKPFLSENCAALPETLLESALFGHTRGAFTGAERDQAGLFELADGGTLLLDEVGDMSPGMQSKLLRVLQEKEFRPLGAARARPVNVRVVAATHRDLPGLVAQGGFRQDLYFRLNGMTLRLPPLRERKEDIPPLFHHLLERECREAGIDPPAVDPAFLRGLSAHTWPGNVRELENVVRRMLLFAGQGRITVAALRADPDLRPLVRGPAEPAPPAADTAAGLRRALEAAGGSKDRAAALLGISRATLYRRLAQFGLMKEH